MQSCRIMLVAVLVLGMVDVARGECIISGVNKPENGQLPDTCREGYVIPDGAKCELTCDEGFKLQGQQPSCTADTFRVGNVMCNDDDFPWWVEAVGGTVSLILIFGLCKGLGYLPFSAATWAPPKKVNPVENA